MPLHGVRCRASVLCLGTHRRCPRPFGPYPQLVEVGIGKSCHNILFYRIADRNIEAPKVEDIAAKNHRNNRYEDYGVNGQPNNMPLQNLYQLLYSTPIDRLKAVEVMYTAPAKYHVSGAAINIVLKTPAPLDGLQGQARVGYNQAHYASYGAGLAATYAAKQV